MPPPIRLIGITVGGVVAVAAMSCSSSSDNVSPTATTPQSISSTGAPEPAPPGDSTLTPVVGSVLVAPIPVPATDGKIHLAYELLLTNASGQEVRMTSVAAVAEGKTLLDRSGATLAYWTRVLGTEVPTTTLGVGVTALVTLDVTVDEPADVPATIEDVISVSLAQPEPPVLPATVTATMAPATIQRREPVVISPPLEGASWVNGNGCCSMTVHRVAVGPLNGVLVDGERFAIDYIQLAPDGREFAGPKTKLERATPIGAGVHAVADGPVVAAVDGLPENVPGSLPMGCPSTCAAATTSSKISAAVTTSCLRTSSPAVSFPRLVTGSRPARPLRNLGTPATPLGRTCTSRS